jgi:hypothetical protein
MQHLTQAADNGTKDAIKEAIKQVDNASQVFAELRMDKSINLALAGQAVDKI